MYIHKNIKSNLRLSESQKALEQALFVPNEVVDLTMYSHLNNTSTSTLNNRGVLNVNQQRFFLGDFSIIHV